MGVKYGHLAELGEESGLYDRSMTCVLMILENCISCKD